ncbi:MAG: AAA family ATPase [Opitutales bacterium]
MSEKDPPNPFEELQRQLREIFKDSNVKVSAGASDPSDDEGHGGSGGGDSGGGNPDAEDPLHAIRDFRLKPKEIRDYLNRFVIRQEEAKKVLSVAICDHYNHVRQHLAGKTGTASEYSKQNILLLGPTGVGKTYLIKNIARLIGVPFVKADATKFSETGYVGSDVEDLVRDLVKGANGDVSLAEHGIIFVDEIDKIATQGAEGGRDVSGRGVQINLLKLMEETEVNRFSPTDMMAQMQGVMEMQRGGGDSQPKSINTRNILFIVSGAFSKLGESIRKRIRQNQIGFGVEMEAMEDNPSTYLPYAETNDFIEFGFEPEFIGRVPVRVACESLNTDDLANILTCSEGSILRQYYDDFRGYGIDFNITPEAIHAVAERAASEGTGARGLMTVMERLLRDFKFELPSVGIDSFEITTETIEDPRAHILELKEQNAHRRNDVYLADIKRFAADFEARHGFTLEFQPHAREALIHEAVEKDRTIQALCEEKFKDYEHGLSIINRNTGQTVFKIGKLAVEAPDKELSKWVVRSIETVSKSEA